MNPQTASRLIVTSITFFLALLVLNSASYVIEPGTRGLKVTLGKTQEGFLPEGFGFKTPYITSIVRVNVRQRTRALTADCNSSDLQQVKIDLRVLFRIPESSVVPIYREFAGDPFDSLIAPRVQEAIKEVTALMTAEQIVKNREQIKTRSLQIAKQKVGTLLVIEDIVIQDIALSKELGHAIEAKMVQEQEASKSKFLQQRAQIEADTAVIQAKGEAESIRIRGEALKANPAFVDLKIVDKWDGLTPLVIGSGDNLLIPLAEAERLRQTRPNAPAQNPASAARRPAK